MKKYDIFKSEGGFRVCGATWHSHPIIAQSPWFDAREKAENYVTKIREADIQRAALELIGSTIPAELYPPEVRERARKIWRKLTHEIKGRNNENHYPKA